MAAAVVVSLLSCTLLSLSATLGKLPTADENFNIVGGDSYVKWGDYRINTEHAPFAKLWGALPLLALHINDAALARESRDRVA